MKNHNIIISFINIVQINHLFYGFRYIICIYNAEMSLINVIGLLLEQCLQLVIWFGADTKLSNFLHDDGCLITN